MDVTRTPSPPDAVERALFLRRLSLLRGFPFSAFRALERTARHVWLDAGDTIDTGERVQDEVAFVMSGELWAESGLRPGRAIGAGQLAGLTHLLARRPALGMTARRPTSALLVSADDLEDLFERHFTSVEFMIHYMARECLADLEQLPDGVEVGFGSRDAGVPTAPLDFVERLGALGTSPMLPAQSLDALAELARHVSEERRDADDVLWRPGDPADHFLLVVAGSIRCDIGGGRAYHERRGATAGEYEALSTGVRQFGAVVRDPVVALRIDRELFLDVLEDHAGMARSFLGVLAEERLTLAASRG